MLFIVMLSTLLWSAPKKKKKTCEKLQTTSNQWPVRYMQHSMGFPFQMNRLINMYVLNFCKQKKQSITFCKPQALSGNRTMSTLIEQPLRYIGVLVQYVVLKGFKLCKDDWLKLCFCRCHWPIKVPDTGFPPSTNCFHTFLFTQLS